MVMHDAWFFAVHQMFHKVRLLDCARCPPVNLAVMIGHEGSEL